MWPRKVKTEKEQSEDFAKMLAWLDQELQGEGFVPWAPFEHPQLGPVEIGGWKGKFVLQNCPTQYLEQECAKTAKFCYRHAKTLPMVGVSKMDVKQVDQETWKLSAVVANSGYLPTFLTQVAIDQKTAQPVTVTLGGGVEFISGKAKVEVGHLEGRAGRSGGFMNGNFRPVRDLPSEKQVDWIVKASVGTELTLTVASEKAGTKVEKVVLK
jgi:hypothetical protein